MRGSRVRVAVVQERFGRGGREKLVTAMVEVMNAMGIVPDIYTLQNTTDKNEIRSFFGAAADFNIRELPDLLPRWLNGADAPYTNLLANFWTRKHDAVLNMNSSMAFWFSSRPVLFYFTVPERHVVLSQKGSHRSKLPGRLRSKFHQLLVHNFDLPAPGFRVICICEYTKALLESAYPGVKATVLYPPIDLASFRNSGVKEKIIVNIGRYSAQKRQLDLLALAKNLREYQFICIGPGAEHQYFRRCRNYVAEHGLTNVQLRGAVPLTELTSTLARAMFYVHMFRFEPFGMSTAEAIAAGCIPVVPDSWGSREIVVAPELRFRQDDEIVTIIRNLERDSAMMENYRAELSKHVERFDKTVFKVEFEKLLRELINGGVRSP